MACSYILSILWGIAYLCKWYDVTMVKDHIVNIYIAYHLLVMVCRRSYKQIDVVNICPKQKKEIIMLRNILLSINLGYIPKLLMLLLDISLMVTMYGEKVLKVIGAVYKLSYNRGGGASDFMLSKDRFVQSRLLSKFAANGPDIENVMILLFSATSSEGAMPVCSDST